MLRQIAEEVSVALLPRLEDAIDSLIDAAAANPASVVREAERRGLETAGATAWERITSLGTHDLEALDDLAESFVHSYTVLAGTQGLLTGTGGFVTMPVTVPADTLGFLVWIVRAASATMYCYGFEAESEPGRAGLRLGLLAATGVPRLRIRGSDVMLAGLTKQVMASPHRDVVVRAAVRAITRRVGILVSQRHLAKVVPVAGGVLNGAVAAGLVRVCGRRGKHHFRQRRLAGAAS